MMWSSLSDAVVMFTWTWFGWDLALRVRPALRIERIADTSVPISDAAQHLDHEAARVAFGALLTGSQVTVKTSGHVTINGVVIVYALHAVPNMSIIGPEAEHRR